MSLNTERMDKEANDFALGLLMPKDKFDEFVHEESCCVEDIAKKFQVTPKVVLVRAEQLGYKFKD